MQSRRILYVVNTNTGTILNMWNRTVVEPDPSFAISIVGYTSQPAAMPGHLPLHTHDGYELCVLTAGRATWWTAEGLHTLRPGDAFISRPNELHGSLIGSLEACDLYWFQFDLDSKAFALDKRSKDELAARLDAARMAAVGPWLNVVTHHYDALLAEFRSESPRPSIVRMHAVAIIDVFAQASTAGHAEVDDRLRCIQAWVLDQIAGPLRVEDIQRGTGVARNEIYRLFREQLGTTPTQWITAERVRIASSRLLSDQSLSRISFDLGFSSTQYFATVFRRHTGVSPSVYRQRMKASLAASGVPTP